MRIQLFDLGKKFLEHAEIQDLRAFPKCVSIREYSVIGYRIFIRRGESVGVDADCYDEVGVVPAKRCGDADVGEETK